LTVTFDQLVALDPGAITLVRLGGGAVGVNVTTSDVNGRTVAVVTFTGPDVVGGSLADGRYTLTVHRNAVYSRDGANTTMLSDRALSFFRLFGDVNGDGKVDDADRAAFLTAYPSRRGMSNYRDYFDFNGDGLIDAVDYDQFLRRFGTSI